MDNNNCKIMKRTNLIIQLSIVLLCAVLFSSCGITRNNDFTSRKYTNFKKGETAVSINAVKTEKDNIVENNNMVKPVEIADISANYHQEIVNNKVPVIDNNANHYVVGKHNTYLATEKVNIKRVKHSSELIRSIVARKSNTTSAIAFNDSQLLLVIIAILLPPLAVFIARGIGSEFWIDILLCLLFWLPGIIYAVLVVLGEV